jgi:hypothetical protein
VEQFEKKNLKYPTGRKSKKIMWNNLEKRISSAQTIGTVKNQGKLQARQELKPRIGAVHRQ